jgi:hypothetical protein
VLAATSVAASAAGGAFTVGLTTGATCSWAVQSQAPWITVTSLPTGVGPIVVALSVAPNAGVPRSATVTIGGQTFTVSQAGAIACTYDIKPDRIDINENGATGRTVNVAAPAGCAWTAVSNVSWIVVTAGQSGSGPGVVTLTIAPNLADKRTGTVTIAGRTLRVDQDEHD